MPRRAPPRIDPGAEHTREAWAVCASRLDRLQVEKDADLRLAALCGTSPPPTTLGGKLAGAARLPRFLLPGGVNRFSSR